jgi:DNA-binding transcriptional ArsR family regulator
MKQLINYIEDITGARIQVFPIAKADANKLPLYLHASYALHKAVLFNAEVILAYFKHPEDLSTLQVAKQLQVIKANLQKRTILIIENIPAYQRKRLIERGVNFIVPQKQMFLPELLIDLREQFQQPKTITKPTQLLPSAQVLLLFHLLNAHCHGNIENHTFKELAQKLDYTPMAVTNAAENLKALGLIEVKGEKEKHIHFKYPRRELWQKALDEQLFINPVLQTRYAEEVPNAAEVLYTHTSALPAYTDMTPGYAPHYAMDKKLYYAQQKKPRGLATNVYEGSVVIEVWKYNPRVLLGDDQAGNTVDPLSLYLTLRENRDERIEMALEQIVEAQAW